MRNVFKKIDIDKAKSLLDYNHVTGDLVWRVRPLSMFKDSRCMRRWNTRYSGKKAGSKNLNGYMFIRIEEGFFYSHRLAYSIFYDRQPFGEIDHINQNKSDNRIINLRDVSLTDNNKNKPLQANNKSGKNGVGFHKLSGKWRVRLILNKTERHFGLFKSKELADLVAIEAMSKFGFHKNHGASRKTGDS